LSLPSKRASTDLKLERGKSRRCTIVKYKIFLYICTMLAKNKAPVSASVSAYRQELDYLYARRSAINSLIESLEEYDRCREAPTKDGERQTA